MKRKTPKYKSAMFVSNGQVLGIKIFDIDTNVELTDDQEITLTQLAEISGSLVSTIHKMVKRKALFTAQANVHTDRKVKVVEVKRFIKGVGLVPRWSKVRPNGELKR